MTVYSTVHVLEGTYPEADSYGEISRSYTIPGGETCNSAIVLSQTGLKAKIDGPYLGTKTKDGIEDYCSRFGIDCSGMAFDPTFDGVQDLVLVDKSTRTVFGRFGSYFRDGRRRSDFDKASVISSRIVSIDPFFGDVSNKLAEFCYQNGKSYITIDCEPGGVLHKHAAATVISGEYIRNNYRDTDIKDLFKLYAENGDGLVIFTFGSKDIMYGRSGSGIQSLSPYRVEVAGTLGAGDTFRGGVVYGVLKQMNDDDIVKFAAATAACVCRRFPMALDRPVLIEIMTLAGL